MDPDRAAQIMVEACSRGQREIMFSIDGTFIGAVKSRALFYLNFFFPTLTDKIIIATPKTLNPEQREG